MRTESQQFGRINLSKKINDKTISEQDLMIQKNIKNKGIKR
ncbi:hypothetical protein VAA_04258 [Vibrio anguillarum 775]|nr:hypothetical protein VAA_04258 [Vibrio anguillarum 775]